jgi:predicted Zn-dependent peptidase
LDFLQKRNQYVEEVTLEQLNRVSADYFTENMLQAEIGSFNKGEN